MQRIPSPHSGAFPREEDRSLLTRNSEGTLAATDSERTAMDSALWAPEPAIAACRVMPAFHPPSEARSRRPFQSSGSAAPGWEESQDRRPMGTACAKVGLAFAQDTRRQVSAQALERPVEEHQSRPRIRTPKTMHRGSEMPLITTPCTQATGRFPGVHSMLAPAVSSWW